MSTTQHQHLVSLGYTPEYLHKLHEGFPKPVTPREHEFWGMYKQQQVRALSAERKLEQFHDSSAKLTAETIKRTRAVEASERLQDRLEESERLRRVWRALACLGWIVALAVITWAYWKC